MQLPESVNIMGNIYSIILCESILDVDPQHRTPMFGNIELYKREIRIFVNERTEFDIWQAFLHEVLHGISVELEQQVNADHIVSNDLLATMILDTFQRNGFLK